MVPLKIQFIATICLITEAYSQSPGYGCPQRFVPTTAPSTGSIIPGGQFCIPAMIRPCFPVCSPSVGAQPALCTPKKQAPVASYSPPACADYDDDSELDRLLYLLVCYIIENKKNSGKKQSSPSTGYPCGSSDGYESCACGYGEDYYDDGAYSTPVGYGSGKDSAYTVPCMGDNSVGEIIVRVNCGE